MSYVALYRKWRPMMFDEIVGQPNIVKVLKNQILNNRIAHAYLFSGGRGTGKTSTAKILSRAVNCLNSVDGNPCNACEICSGIISGNIMDVVEIDAASNNSVEDIRLIRDEVFYMPSVAKFRVYIIDEVHMLSIGAFNALLKILEEPPKHVVFILATTESHKLPATILSRCQRFEFKQINTGDMEGRLNQIVKENKAAADEDALELIARSADGALRDAISILDQCMDGNSKITRELVSDVIGLPREQLLFDIAEAIAEKDFSLCIQIIDQLAKSGKDLTQFISVLVRVFRDIMIYKTAGEGIDTYLATKNILKLKELSSKMEYQRLVEVVEYLSEMEASLKWAAMPRVVIEVGMLKLCKDITTGADNAFEDRLLRLEEALSKTKLQPEREAAASKHIRTQEVKPIDQPKVQDKASVQNNMSAEDYLEKWEEVISALKSSGKMVLYANLIGTKAKKIDEKTIAVVLDKDSSEFRKTVIMKSENTALLKSVVSKVTGIDYNIKCISDEIKARKQAQKVKEDTKVEELAKKFNVPINVIEE
ncbi:MAG: DNA polymerase III subunit gamma/tau [Deltaproteobacteria bacterium]